jgi:hypothetical protein
MELTYEEKRILLINLIDWADNEPESLAADMLNDRRLQRKLMDFLGMKFITPPKKERQRREQARFSDIERKLTKSTKKIFRSTKRSSTQ